MSNATLENDRTAQTTNPERTRNSQQYRPDVDILESRDELLILADMPGVKSEDIDIRFEDGSLTIRGSVSGERVSRDNFLLREFGVGDYFREFRVSEQIDPAKIAAEYHGGVLHLHLPKAETAKPRKIKVGAAS